MNKRFFVKDLMEWLSQYPEDTPVYITKSFIDGNELFTNAIPLSSWYLDYDEVYNAEGSVCRAIVFGIPADAAEADYLEEDWKEGL